MNIIAKMRLRLSETFGISNITATMIFLTTLVIIPLAINWFSNVITWVDVKSTLNNYIKIYIPLLMLSFLLIFFIIYRMYARMAVMASSIKTLDQERLSLMSYVEELRERQYVDVITGIPNNLLWEENIKKMLASPARYVKGHAILIDMVGFGKLNKELKPHNADLILRMVAQGLRGGMRRDEQMYRRRREKIPLGQDNDAPEIDIYRRYRGGDEFYIFVKGSEAEAVGFITRLHKNLRTKISEEISSRLTMNGRKLIFYGAVSPVFREDSLELIEGRLDDLICRAKYDSTTRLIWHSLVMDEDAASSDFEKKLYDEALREFR